MKFFNMTGQINDEMLEKFQRFIEEHEKSPWTLYLASGGGYITTARLVIHLINQRHSAHLMAPEQWPPIVLIGGVCLYSSAFDVFRHVECPKKIVTLCRAMVHLSYSSVSVNDVGKYVYLEDEVIAKNHKVTGRKIATELADFVGLSGSERKSYFKGQDTYIDFERLKKIFPEAEII